MIRIKAFLPMVAAAALLAGCAGRLLAPEILQQGIDDHIYTRYTIRYEDPAKISSLNIQKGRALPAGTMVGVTKLTEEQITLRDPDGNEYTIDFNRGERMCSMREFVRQLLTLSPPEQLLKDFDAATVENIRSGRVVKGMTAEEVMLAFGPPPPVRTPDLTNSTWYYWTDRNQGLRVIFRGGKVRDILVLE